jgi:transposase
MEQSPVPGSPDKEVVMAKKGCTRNTTRPRRPSRSSLPPGLERVNLDAAGIDVGAKEHFVAVPPGRDREGQDVRSFGAFTGDLVELANWLKECGVRTVAMESTGVYWICLYDLLESRGFRVMLVDPRRLKNVPGRKTDVIDCQWIQRLHTFGLLEGAFRPTGEVCELRAYVRQRAMLVTAAAEHIQHMQKALTQMNIKLQHVVSDISGVTGMGIVRAIVAGERDPLRLAALRQPGCHNDEATIARALEGNWRAEHLFALRQAVELYDAYQVQLLACDQVIDEHLARIEDHSAGKTLVKTTASKPRKNEPKFDVQGALFRMTGVDLTRIEGIQAYTALKVLAEIGPDITRWPTSKHFASWLGLCPGNKITGGRRLSGKTKLCANRAAAALRFAAQSLHHSNSALGAFLRRKAMEHGMPNAITATAHKLARLIYSMLRYGTEYVTKSQDQYEQQYLKHTVTNLKRRAKALGFKLIPEETRDPQTATA